MSQTVFSDWSLIFAAQQYSRDSYRYVSVTISTAPQSRRGPRYTLNTSLICWSLGADAGSLRASGHCYNCGVFCSHVVFWCSSFFIVFVVHMRVCLLSLRVDLINLFSIFFLQTIFCSFKLFAPQTNFWNLNPIGLLGRKREIYFLSRRFKWLNLLQVYVSRVIFR